MRTWGPWRARGRLQAERMGGVGLVKKVDLEKSDSTRLFMNGVLLRTIANGMIREFVLVVTRGDLGSQHVLQTQPCAYPTNISSTPALSGERERDACHFTHGVGISRPGIRPDRVCNTSIYITAQRHSSRGRAATGPLRQCARAPIIAPQSVDEDLLKL